MTYSPLLMYQALYPTFGSVTTGVYPGEYAAVVFRSVGDMNMFNYDAFTSTVSYPHCTRCMVNGAMYDMVKANMNAIAVQLLSDLSRLPKRVLVTGHGVGGSMALLLALELRKLPSFSQVAVEVITFGAPSGTIDLFLCNLMCLILFLYLCHSGQ